MFISYEFAVWVSKIPIKIPIVFLASFYFLSVFSGDFGVINSTLYEKWSYNAHLLFLVQNFFSGDDEWRLPIYRLKTHGRLATQHAKHVLIDNIDKSIIIHSISFRFKKGIDWYRCHHITVLKNHVHMYMYIHVMSMNLIRSGPHFSNGD